MQSMLKSLFVTAALLVLWSVAALLVLWSVAAPQVSPKVQLAAAEAKWAANKPKAFEFTIRQLCFCVLPPWAERWNSSVSFELRVGGVGGKI